MRLRVLAVSLLVLAPACLLEEPGELVLDRSPAPTPTPEPTFSSAEIGQRFGDAVYRVAIDGCGFLPGWGTAFAVDDDLLMTNAHVVASDPRVTLTSRRGTEFAATVVTADFEADLAVLRSDRPLPAHLPFATPREVVEGVPLTVIGYPAPRGDFSVSSGTIHSISGDGVLSTDAQIDQGNSGGPGIDDRGRVAGVVYALQSTRFRLIGLLLPVESALRQLADARQGSGTYDVLSCPELEEALSSLQAELERYFREPPTPPPG